MSTKRSGTLDRATLINLAAQIVDSDGLDALTLKALANAAGVTQPALYRHIESLNDIWRELGLLARVQLADALAESILGVSGVDAVHAAAHAWRDFGRHHPGRYRSTERARVGGDAELEAAVQRVLDVLGLTLASFQLTDTDLAHGARLLRSALHGFVAFELGDGHPLTPPIDETFDRLVDMLCSGFEASARQANDTPARSPR